MDINFIWYGLIGILGGVLGGMGMGGGTILIPLFTIFFNVEQHLAQAVNLVSFVPTGIVALIFHIINKLIVKKGILYLIIPAVIFSVASTLLSINIKGETLQRIFGGFLLILSIIQFFSYQIIKKFTRENK